MEPAHSSIDPPNQDSDRAQLISIDRSVRWQICRRLQELDIVCDCLSDGRLRVLANTPAALVQLRSVLQQWSVARSVLVRQLEDCWQQSG